MLCYVYGCVKGHNTLEITVRSKEPESNTVECDYIKGRFIKTLGKIRIKIAGGQARFKLDKIGKNLKKKTKNNQAGI